MNYFNEWVRITEELFKDKEILTKQEFIDYFATLKKQNTENEKTLEAKPIEENFFSGIFKNKE